MSKDEQIRLITEEILLRVKSSFETHKRNIQRLNAGGNSGGMGTGQASQTFYRPIDDLINELKTLGKSMAKSEKLRKQRRAMYDKKINSFVNTLEDIRKKKVTIKIKINDNLIRLTKDTLTVIEDNVTNLRNFDKQAATLCGKAHDYKIAVERSMTELSEYAFLWSNISNFQSLTNDSVKQIYKAVEYNQNDFKYIHNEIKNLWPDPKVEVIQKEVRIPQIQVIKQDHNLIEAHQLLFGFTRSQNITKAIEMYQAEANKEKPHPTTFCALGQLHEEGKWVPKDLNKALNYFKKAADLKNSQGQYKIGQYLQKGLVNSKQYFNGMYPNRQAEIRAAIEYYEKAAKQGHLDAMTDLGYIYERGVLNQNHSLYFIEPHPEHALKYYQKASKSNFPRAYNNLGTLYLTASSLPEDTHGGNMLKGVNYLEKSAQMKYPRACFNLGKCYENGVGVVQSIDRARSLYLKGSELNDMQCKLQFVKSCLGSKIDDDKTLITMVELTRQVLAEDGRKAQALYYMGLFAQQGIGMEKNKQSSFYYIETAARLEYAPAITKLGDFYYSGYFVTKDIEYAKKLYERAAKSDPKALINLGVLAEKGIGQQNDPRKAQQLYEQAASKGHPDALVFLSMMPNPQIKPTEALTKASIFGSKGAQKILRSTNTFVPKKAHEVKNYVDTIKTRQNFYIKESMGKRKMHN